MHFSLVLLVAALSTSRCQPYGSSGMRKTPAHLLSESVDGDMMHQETASGFEHISNMIPEDALADVHELFTSIDVNEDAMIDREELSSWLLESLAKRNNDEANERMAADDSNHDGILSWREVATGTRGHTEAGLNFSNDTSDRQSVLILEGSLNMDRQRFAAADINGDEQLNVTEYAAFIHPYDYAHMAVYEMDRALADLDYNHDEAIDEWELFGNAPTGNVDLLEAEKEMFELSDVNDDGQLNGDELLHWAARDLAIVAEAQADDLFELSDNDHDGLLTEAEVLAQHKLWLGTDDLEQGHPHHAKDEL